MEPSSGASYGFLGDGEYTESTQHGAATGNRSILGHCAGGAVHGSCQSKTTPFRPLRADP